MGQTRQFRDVSDMSGLPRRSDISGPGRHFAFVPISEVIQTSLDHLVGAGKHHGGDRQTESSRRL
jgi:hypothetical protein